MKIYIQNLVRKDRKTDLSANMRDKILHLKSFNINS